MNKPKIICLCGSTKFKKEYEEANKRLTLEGYIILAPGAFHHSDEAFKQTESQKHRMDILHLQKIEMCDFILVVNPDGYIGESTHREILYAKQCNKAVKFLNMAKGSDWMEEHYWNHKRRK